MNKAEFARAFALAESAADLSAVDDACLSGFMCRGAEPRVATIKQVARSLRDYKYLMRPGFDMEAVEDFRRVAVRRVIIVGSGSADVLPAGCNGHEPQLSRANT